MKIDKLKYQKSFNLTYNYLHVYSIHMAPIFR